jgi:hypothetical protein
MAVDSPAMETAFPTKASTVVSSFLFLVYNINLPGHGFAVELSHDPFSFGFLMLHFLSALHGWDEPLLILFEAPSLQQCATKSNKL